MYNQIVLDHFENPRRSGQIENPDAIGIAGSPGAGPFMVLYLAVTGDCISDARYKTYGCAPAIAAGSVLSEWLIGRSLAECLALTEPDLTEMLGGLPDHKRHCSGLAIAALRAACSKLPPTPEIPASASNCRNS